MWAIQKKYEDTKWFTVFYWATRDEAIAHVLVMAKLCAGAEGILRITRR